MGDHLPTKRFYTDPYYVGDEAQAPFAEVFGTPGQSCSTAFAFAEYDYNVARHTNTRELGLPYLVSEPRLCFATQVVTFQQGVATDPLDHASHVPSGVLGSQLVAANSRLRSGTAGRRFPLDGESIAWSPPTGRPSSATP
jgi:hypothetical protein